MLSDPWHRHVICPGCGSQVRHRLLAAILNYSEDFGIGRLLKDRRVLHFAPEPVMTTLIRVHASEYVSADSTIDRYRNSIQLDIASMPGVEDNTFHTIIACDVLEHVPNHVAATQEIKRVLKPDGTAILTVPQPDGVSETLEDPSIVDPAARERTFGQFDHVRLYGLDFPTFLIAQGFDVSCMESDDLPDDIVIRHVLHPPYPSSHPLATNHRRIYFARKT